MNNVRLLKILKKIIGTAIFVLCAFYPLIGFSRDVDYNNQELTVYVTPGEPTQIQFPDDIQGGFKKSLTALSLDRKKSDLVIFSSDALAKQGEAIIVRLKDGRSYSLRVKRADDANPRDAIIRVKDRRSALISTEEEDEENPAYADQQFKQAKSNQVSGLMREMILATEFGKASIPGYKVSDRYKGETILNDGTLVATVDRIFIGANLWGYVINATNLLDQAQLVNPATFRINGTRAISAQRWELGGKPLDVEQQLANTNQTKIYVIARPRKN